MKSLRVAHREQTQPAVQFVFEGETIVGFTGESIGAALWAAGHRRLRLSPTAGTPRGMFCAMGSCQECAVLVNGIVRTACNTTIEPGLEVRALAKQETHSP